MSKLNITKRDGSIVAYNPDKVVDAIMSAFAASKEGTLTHAQEIARSLNVMEGMSVEEIQNQVEYELFKFGYFETAKNYILYRKEHTETRETLERLKFLMDYCKAQNAATGSKFDANANVEHKNIATLIGELPKGAFIRLNRKMLTDRIKAVYGNDLAKKYLDLLEHHFIYKNDETSLANYCASITMYPWLLNGTFSIGGNSKAPTNLKSFCGGFINMVFIVSSMLSGACMHKDQRIIVRKNGICYSVTSKQLIESYFVDGAKVETYNDTKNDWEFVRVSGLEVFEDGKFVDVTKVYRRKYNDLIYKVKTKDGYIAQVSKDHKFKQLFRDRTFESKAETLKVNDTLFMEKDFTPVVNFESPDWKKGWVVGHIVGNGNITQKNYVRLAVCYDYDFYGEIFTKYVKEWLDVDVLKRDGNRCRDYYANSETLYKALKEYIKGDNCYNKHIDTDNKSLDFLLGYLDGLFCADGSYIEDSGATFTTVSSESIQNVKDILGLINSFGHIRTDEAHDNKATTYTTHVRLCNCKYFKHLILKKRAFKSKRENVNIHRDVYYYGANALKNATSNKRNLWCNSKRDDYKKTDVIDSIETFVNDDEYVYEIETRTHWYNCGGFITHNCATPEFLMYMNYFIGKEYGKDYWKNPQAQADLSLKKRTIDKVITDCFEQIVYSLNQPTGARNFQAVFWNVAYYDKYYFESLFGEFRFPDGEKPDWDGLDWLQKRFMKWFNQERTKTPITFPVETMALLTENGKPKDEEYGDFTAEMYSEGHSFFTYMSDNADSLSSCCFSKDTKILWKSSTTGVHLTTLEELHNLKWNEGKKNLKIFHNGSWVRGKSVKLPNRPMFKVTTENGKTMIMTDNHINLTMRGEITTDKLTTSDYLLFNTATLSPIPEYDEHLNYEQGFLVGMFLGDGSFGSEYNGEIRETNLSLNFDKWEHTHCYIFNGSHDIDPKANVAMSNPQHHVIPVRVVSPEVSRFIQKWTNWKRGMHSENKELNLNCLTQSVEFRKGILDGWYNTDGGNSNRCYTTSQKLAEGMEALITSLGINTNVSVSDRTDEKVVIRGVEYKRNFPLYCIRWYNECNHRVNKDVNKSWVKRNNSIYFKIKSIEPLLPEEYTDDVYCIECNNADEPYFTLPNGLITHNCRLRNEIQDNGFSYTLGAGGVSTGSKSVLTINLNRCIQYAQKYDGDFHAFLEDVIDVCHKVQICYNENLKFLQKNGMLPLYDAGYINIKRQYLTIGINGLVEAAEYLGLKISPNEDYKAFVQDVLGMVEKANKSYCDKKKGLMFNCEMIPAENVGVKHAKWDKEDGYVVPRDCYNSYFYVVEDENTNVIDKFLLHGKPYIEHLTGGSALHMNLNEHLSKEQYKHLMEVAAREGCNYFTFNIPNTVCNDCGHITKHNLDHCPVCGSKNVDYLTRIIGYLKRVSNFSKARQEEAGRRYYAKGI